MDRENTYQSPTPGSWFEGRYRIVEAIGRGGMGSVYLAEDARVGGMLRALKFTKPLPEEREAFIAEARMMGGLQHPHLPRIVDYYPPGQDGLACIVMDYIAGESLASRWERHGRSIPFSAVLRYMLQLCDVLRYLHAQEPPVVFRDLKPANVIVDTRDRAVLVDFGIARRYRPAADSDTLRLGTPGFAAPEQLKGEQSDARTDLFGLGSLVYYLLSGGSFAIVRERAVRLGADVPPRFEELLERMLSVRPDDRPASASALYAELCSLTGEDGLSAAEGRNSGSSGEGSRIVAVASAYPGAGGSFASAVFSAALSAQRADHALAECPGGDPELFDAWDGGNRMPRRAAFADPAGMLPAAPVWRVGSAAVYPLDPSAAARRAPEPAFAGWLRRLGPRLTLLDVSSRWEEPGVAEWLAAHADSLYVVVDCLPAKWNVRRQRACAELIARIRGRGGQAAWIANRDMPFRDRGAWLNALPEKPALHLPCLPAREVAEALWRGDPVPADAGELARIGRFLQRENANKSRSAEI
ncbi:serine/threonine-protein kinase [Cohnella zeiphila]|uniref:non-specific serine/threonine protein kinase n=1 Tax=Cohnella zeiphila TaxID=2761120 RepID=A0A7X0SI10_9BACL|nr:serine/threonine-protein kinase [Cohnella zeiphila]MBB6730339.1 serine/threonine protein kinase [Cohnella zeiphila]